MAENLLQDTWADLDQADLRLLLEERIGGPGQRDGKSNVLYLPLARENCRVSLTYKGSKIVAIELAKLSTARNGIVFVKKSKRPF